MKLVNVILSQFFKRERPMVRPESPIQCNVKQYRMARGWSQTELAEKVEIRRQAIYDIESGRYLPNTAIALRMARVFGCRVEDLFAQEAPTQTLPVHVIRDTCGNPGGRIALGRVRDRLVGIPLQGPEAIPFGLRPADGLLAPDGKSARLLASADRLDRTLILMGCDPAFEILGAHIARAAPDTRVHCLFASSHRALDGLAQGMAHVAGTHLHNTGKAEANVVLAGRKLAGKGYRILGFSLLEEGLMVAPGNPRAIRTVADLVRPGIHLANREPGAALRVLLDDLLRQAGIAVDGVSGYADEVASHREGAYRIACHTADAALGLRAVAEAFGLGFVPLEAARCDLVIPDDLADLPSVQILFEVLQSAALRREINAIPGYDGSMTGTAIA